MSMAAAIVVFAVPFIKFGSILFALKAAWHWHEASEVLASADLAGMSDGRNLVAEVLQATLEQSAKNAKGALAAAVACILAAVTFGASYVS